MGVKLTAEQLKSVQDLYKSGDKEGAIALTNKYAGNTTSTPSTPSSTTSTPSTSTANKSSNVQWSNTNYKDSDGYYSGTERNAATGGAEFGTTQATGTTQDNATQDNATKFRNAWDSFSYAEQQKRLQDNPNLQSALTKYGATNKTPDTVEETSVKEETPKGETPTNWDYQDNSPERMMQMVQNLEGLYQTDPGLFTNEETFRNFFINGKGRSPEQEQFLMDYYKNRQTYNKYDGITAENAGNLLAHGQLPQNYLSYVKNSNPDRYAAIMDAKDRAEDKIKDETALDTINSLNGYDKDTTTSKAIEWLKSQGLFLDNDGNLIDDRTENYATEEEKQYAKNAADIIARNLDIDNTIKHTYEDLVKAYPGATKATLMAMAQDTNADLLREKENNNVELTRLQGYMGYMQTERQERNRIGENAINQLQKQYGMYYDYTPEGMSELAQAQYAATNVTLDQADYGTDTQKQMALDSVLTPIYEQYGSIIQRSKAQVINDIIAYANNKGISLSQALEDNFMTPLKNKDAYKQYQASLTSGLGDGNWTLEPIKDAKGNITGYVRINKTTGEIVPYTGTAGAGAAGGTYNETTGVYNYEESGMKGAGLKNNNPGNITDSNVGEVGRNGKFAVFETPEDGFDALVQKIQNAQNGLSKNYPATATLYQFFEKYAPKSDNNNPKAYAESVATQLGVSPNAQIKDLDTIKFAAAIAKHDSGYNYSTYGMFRGQQGVQGGTQGGDYYWRSPMDNKFEEAISNAGTQAAKDALGYANTVYSNLYEIASDGSLDQFIQSGDFQKIMSNLNVSKALTGDTTRGQSFFNELTRAIEKTEIVNPNSQRVMNILKNMVEQKLRDESGAAISSSEWLSNFQGYLPQAGESKDVSLAKMQQWEKNVILKTLVSAGMSKSDYEWLFAPDSKYYKTMTGGQAYDNATAGKNEKGTFEIGVGSVAQMPSGGQYDDLFSMLRTQ